MAVIQDLGRPPRINFVVSTDYAKSMSRGGTSQPGDSSFTLHLEVLLTPPEAAELGPLLAGRRHQEALDLVTGAINRVTDENDPAGDRFRETIKAAFRP